MEKLKRVNWVMLFGGLVVVVGFFLPWLSFGPEKIVSGSEVASITSEVGDSYYMLYAIPALGLCIAAASLRSRKLSAGLGILAGTLVLGWALFEIFRFLHTSTFSGLWITIFGAVILLLGGIVSGHWRNPPDEEPEPGVPMGARSMSDGTMDTALSSLRKPSDPRDRS